MNRRTFISTGTVSALGAGSLAISQANPLFPKPHTEGLADQEYYELRVYQLRNGGGKARLGAFLSEAFIPAVKKAGASTVGVFTEMALPEPPKMYVLIAYPSMESFQQASQSMMMDETYVNASKTFHEIPPEQLVYTRFVSSFLQAFSGLPQLTAPEKKERIFELRIYESYNEEAGWRKVHMFNNGEIDIFHEVSLTPVFFGKNLIGPQLPALTYMLVFDNMEARDKNWQAFLNHPDWAKMKANSYYDNTVSSITRVFLEPTDYSDV